MTQSQCAARHIAIPPPGKPASPAATAPAKVDRLGNWSVKGVAGGTYRVVVAPKRRAVGTGTPLVREVTLAEAQTVMDVLIAQPAA